MIFLPSGSRVLRLLVCITMSSLAVNDYITASLSEKVLLSVLVPILGVKEQRHSNYVTSSSAGCQVSLTLEVLVVSLCH